MSSQIMSAPCLPRYGSSLSRQIREEKELERDLPESITPSRSPSKARSLSDASKPSLSPSPAFLESRNTGTKDDSAISSSSPITPRRPNFQLRGLSLQMPQRESPSPLSPKLDQTQTFGTPVLPRRSRGLDFSRACTNLHHSTLAESSPDASPTITSARGMHIPRKSLGDVTNNGANGLWSTSASADRTTLSSSVSSVNMLDSDGNESDTSDEDLMDRDGEDTILNTPQVLKLGNNFSSGPMNSPGGEWSGNQFSPAAASLMGFHRRARLGKHQSRNSSSSGRSSKPSPAPLSPPVLKSVESQGYFGTGFSKKEVQSRRESLSLGTNDLHLSDSGDDEMVKPNDQNGSGGSRGVIRRAVTRRGNMLVSITIGFQMIMANLVKPKTKNFARIRAALFEEAAPIDSEARREAEVIHQVRESEPVSSRPSPRLAPSETLESVLEDEANMMQDTLDSDLTLKKTNSFSHHAEKNSGGLRFWNTFDERYRTPPPQLLPTRSSSGVSDDISMTAVSYIESGSSLNSKSNYHEGSRSRSSTPLANNSTNGPPAPPTAAEVSRKVNNKRRREDDFDPDSFKRRAVSPGLSVQSSPVLTGSPVLDGKAWGRPPSSKANGQQQQHNDRSNSAGSSGGGIKRVGFQGMTETHDGLMNMSIE